MNELQDVAHDMSKMTLRQLQQQNAVTNSERRKTTAFSLEMHRLEHERALENDLRKRMDMILSDVMTLLKKSGDQTRQTN